MKETVWALITFIVLNLFLLPVAFVVYSEISSTPSEDQIKKVDCFDKLNNKIEGVTCIKEINGLSNQERVFVYALGIVFFVFLEVMFFMVSLTQEGPII